MLDEPGLIRALGDGGPICTSGKGGGLGKRGECEGEAGPMTAAIVLGEVSRDQ